MKKVYEKILWEKVRERNAERVRVDLMLKECVREHVTPVKDYWHKLDELNRQVKVYEKLMETTK